MSDFFDHAKGSKLAIEYGAKIRLEIPGVIAPLESRMVGMENEFIIVTAPPNPQGALDHKLFEGNELVVRYLSRGTVYSFQTKLHSAITSPIPLLFLIYPKIVQRDELRGRERISCMIPTLFTYKEEETPGAMVDLSATGCRCIIRDPGRSKIIHIDTEKNLSMLCKFPGVKRQVLLNGFVRNINKSKKKIDLGIMFTKDTPSESLRLVSWYISTIASYVEALGG